MTLTASELVAQARREIREIAPVDAADLLAAGSDAVLIDVRETAEFGVGHLPGASHIPRGVLEFQVEAHPALACETSPALSVRHRTVLVYCRSGGRSALAAHALQRMGFRDVRSIAGGIQAWEALGLPLARPRDVETA